MDENASQAIIRYHERTKHHFQRYARSRGYMDWDNQPNPFRFYEGLTPLELPFLETDPPGNHLDLYRHTDNPVHNLDLKLIAAFLELSLGLSAWKAVAGSRWSLRTNPSSGNLHPTEAYLLLPAMAGLPGGVYHYSPLIHALEPRAEIPPELWQNVSNHFKTEGFLIGLSSIFWRESWKYGERAFRYCNHDVGHALACLRFAANMMGWKMVYLNALSHEEVETLLGFDKVEWKDLEEDHAELMCFVHRSDTEPCARGLPEEITSAFAKLPYRGRPNTLSADCIPWEIIERAASVTRKPKTSEQIYKLGSRPYRQDVAAVQAAARIIRQRRSAVDYDPNGSLQRDAFLALLDKTLPRHDGCPFDIELGEPCVDLLLFVHRVEELPPGMYYFLRRPAALEEMKVQTDAGFQWQNIEGGFPLYMLKAGDFRHRATAVSCEQEIAGASVFSLGMIARFKDVVEEAPYRYRHLFWECGMIGQVLYLEAEAHGARGTGIGCFFDDPVHEMIGLEGTAHQSLYHFTIGRPVEDKRLTTYPPYYHLKDRQVRTGSVSGAITNPK